MGQGRMFFREAEDQAATEEELGEAVSPPTSVHTHFPPRFQHTVCGEEEEKEGGW